MLIFIGKIYVFHIPSEKKTVLNCLYTTNHSFAQSKNEQGYLEIDEYENNLFIQKI